MTGCLLGVSLLLLLCLRLPVLVVLGIGVVSLYSVYGGGHPEYLLYDTWSALNLPELLAIPLFLFAAAIMSGGSAARRLIDFWVAATRPLPGGLALATVLTAAGFSAFAGSATMVLLAIGPVMYQALLENDYDNRFAVGLICGSSVLGLITPPSTAYLLYGVVTNTSIADLLIAAIGPALVLIGLLAGYVLVLFGRQERSDWESDEVWQATQQAFPALVVPVVVIGGVYSAHFTVTEAALVAFCLAAFIELVVYRELRLEELRELLIFTCRQLGSFILILCFAMSLGAFLVYEQVPQQTFSALQGTIDSPAEFLLLANAAMLLTGMVLDAGSAVLVLGPVLEPLAQGFGIGSVQLGVMLVLNLGLGYLLPPMGSILLAAMGVFRTNFAEVLRAVLPFIGLMLVALVVVASFPGVSTFLMAV